MSEPEPPPPPSERHRTIPITCLTHGAASYCNLRLRKVGGLIELDPHIDGSCILRFDEQAATALRNTIDLWLG